ncbi:cardiolipin synthase [Kriegella sp. EG-1]|nr:cardiolipin synthase [Flavobacteriaceae bacterium EG-1]
MWSTIFLSLYVFVALIIVLSILLHGVRPSKTLAWLLTIFTIPVGGMLLYILLGRNRRKNKLLKRKKRFSINSFDVPLVHSEVLKSEYGKLIKLIHKNCYFPITHDNQVEFLKNGKKTFDAIFEALNNAENQIHLQYYIFEEGELADRFFKLFQKKINQGVKVRMIYDGVGSFTLTKTYVKKLLAIGVEVYPFLPFKFGRFIRSINYRNHRKIIVVDGKVAFTGGINISDKYLKGDPDLGKWHDMHLRIEGSASRNLDDVFASDWYLVCQKSISMLSQVQIVSDAKFSNKKVQIVSGGPDDDFPVLEQAYFTIINQAKDYLFITNPYIIPGPAILQALQTAALSGVDVRLMISEKVDSIIVGWCVRSYFEGLLKSGIKIYLFPDGFLHSKIIVSDDKITTIGTANLDDRSFEQNYEVNAIIYDDNFAKLLKDDFLKESNISRLLSYEEHLNRPFGQKLKEGFGKVFSPLL